MLSSIKALLPNLIKRNCKEFVRNVTDSLQYYAVKRSSLFCGSPVGNKKILRVIFVCKGNVCRSAFAEYRLKYLLDHDIVHIDSCGVDVDQGVFPPQDSVTIASEFSCSLAKRRAKGLAECDLDDADLILAMEYWQYKRLVRLYPQKKENVILLRSLTPFPYCLFCNIADPYGWGEIEFRRAYRLIDRALDQIVLRWEV